MNDNKLPAILYSQKTASKLQRILNSPMISQNCVFGQNRENKSYRYLMKISVPQNQEQTTCGLTANTHTHIR